MCFKDVRASLVKDDAMSQARVHLSLSAQQIEGGLVECFGLGMHASPTPTNPMGLIIEVTVPWDELDQQIDLEVVLVDDDGLFVNVDDGVSEPQRVSLKGWVKAERNPLLPDGTESTIYAPFNISGGLPLKTGRHEWRVTANGQEGTGRWFMVTGPA